MEKEAQNARRQPLILKETAEIKKPTCGEIVGGKTAECAAICCCCPCAVLDLVILTAVKLPAGMCKKAMKKRRKRKARKGTTKMEGGGGKVTGGDNNKGGEEGDVEGGGLDDGGARKESEGDGEVKDKDKDKEEEMWARFISGGFWRNPSESEKVSKLIDEINKL